MVEIGNHAQRQSVLAQPCEHRFRCGVANPIRRVGEEGEQRVEVGLELREMTDIRERCSHQLPPPFAFQPAQLCGLVAWTEGESRRSAERAPEGIDHEALVGLDSEAPRDSRIAQPGRLAGMKERTGRVKKCRSQHAA